MTFSDGSSRTKNHTCVFGLQDDGSYCKLSTCPFGVFLDRGQFREPNPGTPAAMNSRSFLPLAVALFLGVSLVAGAQEWTRFRGPNGSGLGVAPKLPAVFAEKDFNWKIELPGRGHSSPVVWGDRVFVTGNPAGTAQRVIACVNAADVKTLWQ